MSRELRWGATVAVAVVLIALLLGWSVCAGAGSERHAEPAPFSEGPEPWEHER